MMVCCVAAIRYSARGKYLPTKFDGPSHKKRTPRNGNEMSIFANYTIKYYKTMRSKAWFNFKSRTIIGNVNALIRGQKDA